MLYLHNSNSEFGKDKIIAYSFPWERRPIIIETIHDLEKEIGNIKNYAFDIQSRIDMISLCCKIMDLQNYINLSPLIKDNIEKDFDILFEAYNLSDREKGKEIAFNYNKKLDFFIRFIVDNLFPLWINKSSILPWLPEFSIEKIHTYINKFSDDPLVQGNTKIILEILNNSEFNYEIFKKSKIALKLLK